MKIINKEDINDLTLEDLMGEKGRVVICSLIFTIILIAIKAAAIIYLVSNVAQALGLDVLRCVIVSLIVF